MTIPPKVLGQREKGKEEGRKNLNLWKKKVNWGREYVVNLCIITRPPTGFPGKRRIYLFSRRKPREGAQGKEGEGEGITGSRNKNENFFLARPKSKNKKPPI